MNALSDAKHLEIIQGSALEAIHRPDQWPRVLTEVSRLLDASATSLAIRRESDVELIKPVAATWNSEVDQQYCSRFGRLDTVSPTIRDVPLNRPFRLEQLVEFGQFRKTPFFNEWANKYEIAHFTAIKFPLSNHEIGVLALHYSSDSHQLNDHRHLLLQAVVSPIQFTLQQRRVTQEFATACGALDRLALGVILLDEYGQVLHCNEQAKSIVARGDSLLIKNRRPYTIQDGTSKQLEQYINEALAGDLPPRGREVFVPRLREKLPLHALILPLSREMAETVHRKYVPVAVFLNEFQEQDLVNDPRKALCAAYGLTEIQADIALPWSEGASAKALATQRGISEETIKSHTKTIYNKLQIDVQTSTNKRIELRELIRRLILPLRRRLGKRFQ